MLTWLAMWDPFRGRISIEEGPLAPSKVCHIHFQQHHMTQSITFCDMASTGLILYITLVSQIE